MDFLESLIASAQAAAKAKAAAKSRGQSLPVDPAERENLYLPHRQIALFYRTACLGCGTVTLEFEGLFEERKHLRLPDLHLVKQPFIPMNTGLPRARKYLPRDVPYCAACAGLDSYQGE